tara:strand:+ start:652 stop:1209 length:558 start_codon:yes stop_codon:yes gene_type:complete
MKEYKNLSKQCFTKNEFSIVPIRNQDRYEIMKWRNDQIYHLRQKTPLNKKNQDDYFKYVISALFEKINPDQILFSFLKNDNCVGYGGLVHIDWINKNAEISFVLRTEDEVSYFRKYWGVYLDLIENVAFAELNFHKIYVYAFDLRPHLYKVLLESNYFKDAVLNDHVSVKGKYIDIVIYSKIRNL